MKVFAEVENGVVVNTSVWSEAPQGEQYIETTNIENVGIGWLYVDGQFIEPVQTVPIADNSETPITVV